MSDYAPSTDAIRGRIIQRGAGWGFYSLAEFDRFLAEHDRQVAERAWDKGLRQAFLNTSKDRFRIKDDRDRLHKAITEALVGLELSGEPDWPGWNVLTGTARILRAALDKEGNDDE